METIDCGGNMETKDRHGSTALTFNDMAGVHSGHLPKQPVAAYSERFYRIVNAAAIGRR